MIFKNASTRYGLISKILHWGLACGLWAMFLFGRNIAHMQPALDNVHLYARHKSFGLLILVLVFFRLAWRFISPPPKLIDLEGLKTSKYAAHLMHFSLYIFMILTPLFGWAGNSAAGFETQLFSWITFPPIVAEDPNLEGLLFLFHGLSALMLVGLSVLHLLAAFYHHFIAKNDTLVRMIK